MAALRAKLLSVIAVVCKLLDCWYAVMLTIVVAELVDVLGREDGCRATAANLRHLIS